MHLLRSSAICGGGLKRSEVKLKCLSRWDLMAHTKKQFKSASSKVELNNLDWHVFSTKLSDLDVSLTLSPGQSFNWQQLDTSNVWIGLVNGVPLAIKQEGEASLVASLSQKMSNKSITSLAREYLQFDTDVTELYSVWSSCCPRMCIVASCLPGIRLIDQDPWECLISFIFSSNNNIKRITKGLTGLRARYGEYVCSLVSEDRVSEGVTRKSWFVVTDESLARQQIDSHIIGNTAASFANLESDISDCKSAPSNFVKGKKRARQHLEETATEQDLETTTPSKGDEAQIHLFTFPTIEVLSSVTEEEFRAMGLGYRAKFLVGTIEAINKSGIAWLTNMRMRGRTEVQEELIKLPGVGRKVADCVALFSMRQCEAVPVDTHVWDIVIRDYNSYIPARQVLKAADGISSGNAKSNRTIESPAKEVTRSLTPFIYESIGNAFRSQFRRHAGWAHSVLFAAELPAIRIRLPLELQQEMVLFAGEKSAAKKSKSKQQLGMKQGKNNKIMKLEDDALVLKEES